MKDNNIVAFYCSNCHKTVWNYEHNFEQLHEKGLCAECLKKQNKPKDKWQKLKEWLEEVSKILDKTYACIVRHNGSLLLDEWYKGMVAKEILEKMQELEGEDE